MDIPSLETALQGYLVRGFSGSTRRSYDSAKRKYLKFCNMFTFEPLPLKEVIICFFAFLRCGEFTSTKEGHSPPLQVDGVRVDDHHKPTCISLFLSKSKTDPYGKGITLFVEMTGSLLCPVAAVLAYLAIRPSTPGPLFLLSSGVPLTRETFVSRLKQGFSSAGIDSSGYNGHS